MLYKPTLLEVGGFDANKEKIFDFVVPSGGDNVFGNRLIIINRENKTEIYNKIQKKYNYSHILPEKTLINGECYLATLSTIDADGNESKPSNPIEFCCYSTPSLSFTNIPTDNIIKSGSFRFDFTYTQSQGDRIQSYVMNLYNLSGVIAASSGRVYVTPNANIYDGYYIFNGLEDNTTYTLELTAESKSGIRVATKISNIKVKYKKSNIFTLLKLENNCHDGYISITSNLIPVSGKSYPENPNYINNKEIDLTGKNYYVQWNEGYNISDDILVRAWFRKPNINTEIIRFSNIKGETIKIKYMEGYQNIESQKMQSYIQVIVSSVKGLDYYIFSNYIDTLSENEYYNLQLKRERNVYEVQLNKII